MNNRIEKERPVLIKPLIHKELRVLSVTSNVKVQHIVNLLLEEMLKDKEKIRALLLDYESEKLS